MIILLDMDDVLDDLLHPWVNWLNKEYGTNVQYDYVTDYHLEKSFPTLTKDDVGAPLYTEEFWKTVGPKEGAVDGVKQLLQEGNDVFVVTNSHYKTLQYKMENVLFKYFPFLTWENVIVTTEKSIIYGDVMVDDHIDNLVGGLSIGCLSKILVDAPHNRRLTVKQKSHVMRAKNWDDILRIINVIKCSGMNGEK